MALSGQSNRLCVCPLLDQSGQIWILARDGLSAFDPKRTAATEMPHRGANFSPRHADEIPSLQME
jgi:ligand-binding sensor domain-containing protein